MLLNVNTYANSVIESSFALMKFMEVIKKQLTNRACSGRTGEYWPEQARLVSCLLYGTLFLTVKCTSGAINLFSVLSFSFQSFYLSNFLASSGSFTVKNDNIHSFGYKF